MTIISCLILLLFLQHSYAQSNGISPLENAIDQISIGDTVMVNKPFRGNTFQFLGWHTDSGLKEGWSKTYLIVDEVVLLEGEAPSPVFYGFLKKEGEVYKKIEPWRIRVYVDYQKAIESKEILLLE